ncbi:MAG: hypothetical protein M1838_003996, partial [Thelocarpon superellum]
TTVVVRRHWGPPGPPGGHQDDHQGSDNSKNNNNNNQGADDDGWHNGGDGESLPWHYVDGNKVDIYGNVCDPVSNLPCNIVTRRSDLVARNPPGHDDHDHHDGNDGDQGHWIGQNKWQDPDGSIWQIGGGGDTLPTHYVDGHKEDIYGNICDPSSDFPCNIIDRRSEVVA